MTKIITITAVVILLGLGGWWYVSQLNDTTSVPVTFISSTSTPDSTTSTSTSNMQATNTSNTSIEQDMTNVDGQMNGLNSDSASVNQGFNDKPISQ